MAPFHHYADSNIRDTTILEALQRPLFMAYHDGQPFNENHLRPCPVLDNKDRLAEMVAVSGARSTDLEQPEDAAALCAKTHAVADRWEPVADAPVGRGTLDERPQQRTPEVGGGHMAAVEVFVGRHE